MHMKTLRLIIFPLHKKVFSMKTYIFSLFIFALQLFGQEIRISGSVNDAESTAPLMGATVAAIEKSTGKVLAGTATEKSGRFALTVNRKAEDFRLRISFVGYSPYAADSINPRDGKADLGVITLSPSSATTGAVYVKGQKPMIEFHIDKQVINMEEVPGSNSGSVSDALKNTGIVEVEPTTSKISIRGNSNVTILIDGKPQAMADNLLSQMPATYVDKVEVITTPSAKDDPEGDGGTINIITKKERRDNFNGSLSAFSSTQNLGFGNFVFNYRKNAWNFFSSGNSYFGELRRTSDIQRTNYFSTALHSQTSATENIMRGYMAGLKLGFDYDIDTMNSLTVTSNWNKTHGKMINIAHNTNYNLAGSQTYSYYVDDNGNGDFNNYTVSSNYKHKMPEKGHEITADLFYSDMRNSMDNLMKTSVSYLPAFPALQKGVNDVSNKTLILNSDYVFPTQLYGKIEAGYKFTRRDRRTELQSGNYSYLSESYSDSLRLSNIFDYTENIHAVYSSYTNKLSIIEYKLGLRVENTETDGKQHMSNEIFSTRYTSLFPSLGLAYKFTEMFQIAFNASRKINRPQMEMINPFVRVNGPNNITRGNPRLEPTYTNSFELKVNPLLNIYYNTSKGRPSSLTTNVDDSVSVTTTINSAASNNYGFEITFPLINEPRFPIKLPEWFKMATLRISYNRLREEGKYLSEAYSIDRPTWRFNGNLSVVLWEGINAMTYYNIALRSEDARYKNGKVVFVGLMLSKEFFDKKLQISLMANDIFDNARPSVETFGTNFYSNAKNKFVGSRSVGLSLRYNFNDFANRQEKTIDDGRDKDEGLFNNR